ncbi:MAG: glycolate oxidase [Solirubrobacteraceae bacterium]|nr:glycolate oxidase [Solirubrobacteraceae bacterium]
MISATLRAELVSLLGPENVLDGSAPGYDRDASESRGLRGEPDAVALAGSTEQVAGVVAACFRHGVAIVPRGGGTGFSGGAVAAGGGVVLSLERMTRVRSFEPLLWRMEVEAGLTTRDVQRLALENGLLFPPDPGAAEQSQIGGNVATNAGGPHAFKYGTTGAWVTGVEAVVAPGRVVRFGGPVRKDVSGYDLTHLLVGSEGTLAVITAVWLRLLPRPEVTLPVLALYPDTASGAAAVDRVRGSGLVPAALEYLDTATMEAVGASMPVVLPDAPAFAVLAEIDGSAADVERGRPELIEALEPDAAALLVPETPADVRSLWRWREGVSIGVTAQRGGKLSEDVVVPVEHLGAAIDAIVEIGARHGVPGCSWGHAGDGNLHATFMIDAADSDQRARAEAAAADVFTLAADLGGSVSGEHGIGLVKREHVAARWSADERALQLAVKRSFDPDNLMNPGKKVPAG